MRDLIVLGGTSHPNLTKLICRNLTIDQGRVASKKFSNGETSIEIQDSVREKDVFIVQSGCGDVNDNFIELLIMIAACKTASAKRVTAVLPLFPYSRQPDVPAAGMSGAPSIVARKDNYTFESAPGTPRPLSRSSTMMSPLGVSLGTPANSSLGLPSGNPLGTFSSIAPTPGITSVPGVSSPLGAPLASVSTSSATSSSNSPASPTGTNSNLPLVDAYGKTASGYKQWVAQNGTLIANLLVTAGCDRLITMDLHDPQFQGFFNIPVDNLYSKPLLKHYIMDYIPNYQECVIVSPDSGGAKRATSLADALGCPFALIHKERRAKAAKSPPSSTASAVNAISLSSGLSVSSLPNTHSSTPMVATTMLVGDVRDKVCLLIDDLVDTSYTITRAAKLLKDQGAKYVYALVTHGVFSGDAINRVSKSAIDKVITTNSVPQPSTHEAMGDRLEVLDVSRILAEAVRRIHNGESVSMLFDHGW